MKNENSSMEYLKEIHARLWSITNGCRVDMHEPDEQGVTAVMVGNVFDNAYGSGMPPKWFGLNAEMMVAISRTERGYRKTEWINLADLVALARLAFSDKKTDV